MATTTATFGGPMFMPSQDEYRRSSFNKMGAHYNIYGTLSPDNALKMLRDWFAQPKQINEMNFIVFSTSGVHGMCTTIEEVEKDIRKFGPVPPEPKDDDDDTYHPREVTFLLIQPRIVGMTYGNAACKTLDDVKFLKQLRARSWKAVQKIGAARGR